jgi:carbamoyltransferase
MNVLGISGRHRDAAAALAVDGCLVAAALEDSFTRIPGVGYTLTGGLPTKAVESCLATAGLRAADLDTVCVVDDEDAGGGPGAAAGDVFAGAVPIERVDPVDADAVQAASSARDAAGVIVWSTTPPAMAAFARDHGRLRPIGRVPGSECLPGLARRLAAAVGAAGPAGDDPCAALDRLSIGGEPEFGDELAGVIAWDGDRILVDERRLGGLIDRVAGPYAGGLADAGSVNVRLQQARRALAASFTCRLAEVVRDGAERSADRGRLGSMAFGGALFANPRLVTELGRLMDGRFALAGVPELSGRALGAALAGSAEGTWPAGLRVGPAYSDAEIKRTLDNCRLDYVYEPDWARLLRRTSKMLAQGKVVAWFQGAMAFGPRPMGARSLLADPSGRYARQNVNEYLRGLPLDEPLPVVLAASVAASCLTEPPWPAGGARDVPVAPAWRDKLGGALDWRQHVRVHDAGPAQAPELGELLECHLAATGVPGLIETGLCGPGEPVACTPRDAVRTVYASAVDALVIGRFVLMKDYWLLRTHAE